jgi:hypothetical protein
VFQPAEHGQTVCPLQRPVSVRRPPINTAKESVCEREF